MFVQRKTSNCCQILCLYLTPFFGNASWLTSKHTRQYMYILSYPVYLATHHPCRNVTLHSVILQKCCTANIVSYTVQCHTKEVTKLWNLCVYNDALVVHSSSQHNFLPLTDFSKHKRVIERCFFPILTLMTHIASLCRQMLAVLLQRGQVCSQLNVGGGCNAVIVCKRLETIANFSLTARYVWDFWLFLVSGTFLRNLYFSFPSFSICYANI